MPLNLSALSVEFKPMSQKGKFCNVMLLLFSFFYFSILPLAIRKMHADMPTVSEYSEDQWFITHVYSLLEVVDL